jgi:hypothetical protein
MTVQEFNEKWKDFLEEGYYGLAIDNQNVIEYLDEKFKKLTTENPKFMYSQIKLKFGMSRVYTNGDKMVEMEIEKEIEKILGNGKEI